MSSFASKTFSRTLAAAVLIASAMPVFADSKTNNALEPMDDPAEIEAASSPAANNVPTASSTPPAADPSRYAGEIRRYPADGDGAAEKGYLSIAITPLGKVSGTITWYATRTQVKVSGKQDLSSRQGDLIVKDADGARVPGAPRLPFRISKQGRLVGGGLTDAGETASFRLNYQAATTSSSGGSYGSVGGATLSLGGVSSYTGASSVSVNTGTLSGMSGSGTLNVTAGGATLGSITTNTSPALTLGNTTSFTGLSSATSMTIYVRSGSTVLPVVTADGNLDLGTGHLLLGPVTITTGTDGSITYTGKLSSGAAGTVVVLGPSAGG